MYRFSKEDIRFTTATRHTKKIFPDIKIYGYPLNTTHIPTNLPFGILKKFTFIFIKFVYSLVILVSPTVFSNESIRAITDATIIISKGGHFYQSRTKNTLKGFLEMYFSTFHLILAIRLKKRFVLLSHSFGPFNNMGSKIILRFVLSQAEVITVREKISQKFLEEVGIKNRVHVTPDTAFAFNITTREKNEVRRRLFKKYKLQDQTFAIITARQWDMQKILYENYLSVLAKTADYLTTKYVRKVILVAHTMGEHDKTEDDSIPIKTIFDKIENKKDVLIMKDDLSPYELLVLYGSAEGMIGTRLHSVIFSFISGVPAIAIAYTHKTKGVAQLMELGEYVINIEMMKYERMTVLIDNLFLYRDKTKMSIMRKVSQFRDQISHELEIILRWTEVKNL
jgi:colanic acid/amylovoran biosynthesis protein